MVEEVIDPPEVQEAPHQWRCIGQEVSERLDYEPARFLRRRLVRRKYVSHLEKEKAPVLAPLPPLLQERSLPAAGLLAQIIVSKYCDHVPLYRQERIYWTRHQVWLPRQNLVRWMELAADWLKPLYEAVRTGVMAGGYVQVDETPVHYLCPGRRENTRSTYRRSDRSAAKRQTAAKPSSDQSLAWARGKIDRTTCGPRRRVGARKSRPAKR